MIPLNRSVAIDFGVVWRLDQLTYPPPTLVAPCLPAQFRPTHRDSALPSP